MRIAVAGGGPGGLFFASLVRRAAPAVEVTVFERNRADDTFGFGVVFSDRTLAEIHRADPVLRDALDRHGRHWDDIELRLKGERIRCGGNGMAAVARRTLLSVLQDHARQAGVDLRFGVEVDLDRLAGHDLVVAADGTGSKIRRALGARLGGSVDTAAAKFIWLGTDYLFDGLTFMHERGPHGVFAVHGYPIGPDTSTFIVETDERTWRRAGLDAFDVTRPPGPSDLESLAFLEKLFAEQIDGHRLLANNSRWGSFRTRRTARWHTLDPFPIALLGDAVHTAHFSVGSGTKMAMEDAIVLVRSLIADPDDLPAALARYERSAQPSVRRIQDSARSSLSWWEHFGTYYDALEPWQFAYHFLSRSITDGKLARRDPGFVADSHRRWRARHGAEPLDTPLRSAGWRTERRVVAVELDARGLAAVAFGADGPLPLYDAPPHRVSRPWGARIVAPGDEQNLPSARAALRVLAAGAPNLVVVQGGSPLTRTLLCEQARFEHGIASLLLDESLDDDRAVTAVLSGRTDLVGRPRRRVDDTRTEQVGEIGSAPLRPPHDGLLALDTVVIPRKVVSPDAKPDR